MFIAAEAVRRRAQAVGLAQPLGSLRARCSPGTGRAAGSSPLAPLHTTARHGVITALPSSSRRGRQSLPGPLSSAAGLCRGSPRPPTCGTPRTRPAPPPPPAAAPWPGPPLGRPRAGRAPPLSRPPQPPSTNQRAPDTRSPAGRGTCGPLSAGVVVGGGDRALARLKMASTGPPVKGTRLGSPHTYLTTALWLPCWHQNPR